MAYDKTLEEAINELMKNYQKAAEVAAKYATKQMTKNIYNQALLCLKTYYENYSPSSYNRTSQLQNSFVPYVQIKKAKRRSNGDTFIRCTMGILYDSTKIDYYDGSKKYQPTDSQWIIDNYLDGIHPTTNGASVPEKVEYIPVTKYPSTNIIMSAYLGKISFEKFSNYMLISFFNQIIRM